MGAADFSSSNIEYEVSPDCQFSGAWSKKQIFLHHNFDGTTGTFNFGKQNLDLFVDEIMDDIKNEVKSYTHRELNKATTFEEYEAQKEELSRKLLKSLKRKLEDNLDLPSTKRRL